MKTEDWLQLASLATVMVALFFSYKQTRDLSQQSMEASKQAAASASALQHSAHRQFSLFAADSHEHLFTSQPGVLSRYLVTRGIPVSSHEDNLFRNLWFQRFDIHEFVYLLRLKGILLDDVWSGWQVVIVIDVAVPEFREVWRAVRGQYAVTFVKYIDALVAVHDNPNQRESPAPTVAVRAPDAPAPRAPDHAELHEDTAA